MLAAAKVGGILANATCPADFLGDNLRIQVNVIDAAHARRRRAAALPRLVVHLPEVRAAADPRGALLTGTLEPTNDAYAIAKIAGILQVQAMRRQHGQRLDLAPCPRTSTAPATTSTWPSCHVLPAMIRKFHEARVGGGPVTLWGTGSPRREFLHVDDLARGAACTCWSTTTATEHDQRRHRATTSRSRARRASSPRSWATTGR